MPRFTPPPFLIRPLMRMLSVTLTLGLSACALVSPLEGDGSRSPRSEVPAQWSAPQSDKGAAATLPRAADPGVLAHWWSQLHDPLLDELVTTTLQAAPDLRLAQARLRQARATASLSAAGLSPSLGANASLTHSRNGTAAGSDGAGHTQYVAGFDATWEPDIFGSTRAALRGAEADVAAQAATLEATRVTLVGEVVLNYVTLRSNQLRLEIARENARSQEETLAITQWRQQAGLTTVLDVEQARSSLAQTVATLPSLESARDGAANRLAVLAGLTPGSLNKRLAVPEGERPQLPQPPTTIAVGIPADTLRQRPDVWAAEHTLAAEVARTQAQLAGRLPSFSLSGSFGWQAMGLSALGGSSSLARSLTGSLAATLFDGGRLRSQILVQDAVAERAAISYEQTLLTALEDVENALTAYATGQTRITARQTAAEAARNAATLARQQYQAGLADFQKVLDTQRTQLSTEDSLATAQSDLLTAVIQLYKALGGGWEGVAPQAASPLAPQQAQG